ncbi:unnamed protein product [Sphagnum tenellum]
MRCCSRAITSSPQVSLAFSLRAVICVHARNLQADKFVLIAAAAAAASTGDLFGSLVISLNQLELATACSCLRLDRAHALSLLQQFIPVLSVQSSAAAAPAHDGSQETTSHLPSHSTLMITLESTSFCFSPWEVHS